MQSELLESLEDRIANVRDQLEDAAKQKKIAFDKVYGCLMRVKEHKHEVESEYVAVKSREHQLRTSLESLSASAAAAKTEVFARQKENTNVPQPSKTSISTTSTTSTNSPTTPTTTTREQVICTGVCLKRGTYLQHKWRARWVELTTTGLRYFCSEFDSVRRDAWPRGSITVDLLTECRLGGQKSIKSPSTGKPQPLQTFVVRGGRNDGATVEFMLATEEAAAIRWVSRIHGVMNRRKFQNTKSTSRGGGGSMASNTARSIDFSSGSSTVSISSAVDDLHRAREERDACQESLLLLLQSREEIASRLRDLKGIEAALLGPLLLQERYGLTAPPSRYLRSCISQVGSPVKSASSRNQRGATKSSSSSSSSTTTTTTLASAARTRLKRATTNFLRSSNLNYHNHNSSSSRELFSTFQTETTTSSNNSASKYVSNQAVWEEGTSFFLGQEPQKNAAGKRSLTETKLNEAIVSLLTLGESMNASDTETDRDALRRVLTADAQKKRLWRVLERLVVERERTKRRLNRLTQRSERFEDTPASLLMSAAPARCAAAESSSKRNHSTDLAVGPLFEINLD